MLIPIIIAVVVTLIVAMPVNYFVPVAKLKISITTKRPAIIVRRSKFFIKIASRIPPAKHILDF